MQQQKNICKLLILISSIFSLDVLATGAIPTATPTESNWQYEITPYLWVAGLDGHTRLPQFLPYDISLEPTNIMQLQEYAGTGTFEARWTRLGFLADFIYADIKKDLPTNIGVDTNTSSIQTHYYAFAGEYRINNYDNLPIDILAGARYFRFRQGFHFDPPLALPQNCNGCDHAEWWDGFGGAKIQYALTDKWKLFGYGDLGAGGSKLSWQAMAGINYEFSQTFVGKFGYRILSENYTVDPYDYKMLTGGFYLGLGMRF